MSLSTEQEQVTVDRGSNAARPRACWNALSDRVELLASASGTQQMDVVLADWVAELLAFYAGWHRATDARVIEALWLTTEEMLAESDSQRRTRQES